MKPTLEQIKTDESVWPEGAEFYDKDIEVFYKKIKGRMELLEVTGEWVKATCNKSDLSGMIPRPTKAFVPEVGVECEGFTTTLAGNWKWCKVEPLKETSSGEYACITEGRILRFIDQFRPIKSERELFIEQCIEITELDGEKPEAVFGKLYDNGLCFKESQK